MLTYTDEKQRATQGRQEDETDKNKTRPEPTSSMTSASVSEEATVTDDAEDEEDIPPGSEERQTASGDVPEENGRKIDREVENEAKGKSELTSEAVPHSDQITPPAAHNPDASAPKLATPQETASGEDLKKSSKDTAKETVPPSKSPIRALPPAESGVGQSSEIAAQTKAKSSSQGAPNADDPSVTTPPVQSSPPQHPEGEVRLEDGMQKVDTSVVDTAPPHSYPPQPSRNTSADDESCVREAEKPATQETTVPVASSSVAATKSTLPQVPVPPPAHPQELPVVQQGPSTSEQPQQTASREVHSCL